MQQPRDLWIFFKNGSCRCADPWVGTVCEYNDAITCSGQGTVDVLTGSCACADPWVGAACADSDAAT